LHYDWYRRASFLDHFFGDAATVESFACNDYPEQGDFVNQTYSAKIDSSEPTIRVALLRKGGVWFGSEHAPIEVCKTFYASPGERSLVVDYQVTNNWEKPLQVRFGVEWCFGLQSVERPETNIRFDAGAKIAALGSAGSVGPHRVCEIIDNPNDLKLALDSKLPAEWWHFPLYTVSLSEDGFERSYQCTVLCAVWALSLKPGDVWANRLVEYAGDRRGYTPDIAGEHAGVEQPV